MKYIPYGRQFIDKKDISSVIKSLNNDLITTGPYVKAFENELSNKLDVPFAYCCNSGTSALYLAFLAINLNENDSIILPSINFIAAANMAANLKAKIFFSDVDPSTGQLTPDLINECIIKNNIKSLKAIVIMYHGGYPREISKLKLLKKKLNCFLIEDACHALGAKYKIKNRLEKIGSCKHVDISTFSLHPLKSITAGEGGIITTRDKQLAKKIKLYRSHGIIKTKNHWEYDVLVNGFNFRLSDLNCSLALSQIKKLEKFIKKRKLIYDVYFNRLNKFIDECKILKYEKLTYPSYHLVFFQIDFKKFNINKEDLIKFLIKKKIITQYHYIPFYKFSLFKKMLKRHKNNFKGTSEYFQKTLSLPIYYSLKKSDVLKISNEIKKFLNKKKL